MLRGRLSRADNLHASGPEKVTDKRRARRGKAKTFAIGGSIGHQDQSRRHKGGKIIVERGGREGKPKKNGAKKEEEYSSRGERLQLIL